VGPLRILEPRVPITRAFTIRGEVPRCSTFTRRKEPRVPSARLSDLVEKDACQRWYGDR
jgi:hypothetical protein